MINTRDIIIRLKEVKEEKNLSNADIMRLIEANNEYVSKTTLSRVFAEGSEDTIFRYEATLRPIVNALLDINTIEENDNTDVSAMKTLLQYKIQRIQELEQENEHLRAEIDREKVKYHEKLDKEREQYYKRIDFLKEQVSLKDKRMDMLLEAVFQKDVQHKELLELILSCPARKKGDCPKGE